MASESKTAECSPYDSMRDEFTRGYVQIYTGGGKGKTTAAIGLAVRAIGAGLRVFFGQFIKGGRYSEIEVLERIADLFEEGGFVCRQYGEGCFITKEATERDREAAKNGVAESMEAMKSGKYDLVILDEANVAMTLGLISEEDLISLIDERPEAVELVLTGRGATQGLIGRADLVTEMNEVKHYYKQGVRARRGIES